MCVDCPVRMLVFMGVAVVPQRWSCVCACGMLMVIVIVNVTRFTVRMAVRGRMVVLDDDVDLGSGQPATHSPCAHFKAPADVQCRSRFFEQRKGYARIDKRAQAACRR